MIPDYSDGIFHLYTMSDAGKKYPEDILEDMHMEICYRELSVFDKIKIQLNASNIDVTMKIVIPQYRKVNSLCVLKIGDDFHHVFNAINLVNKDGFPETEITLEKYSGNEVII